MNERSEPTFESIIEIQANFESNDTLLLFERLKNPIIRKQIIDLHMQAERNYSKESDQPLDDKEKILELESDFDLNFVLAQQKTDITFEKDHPSPENMVIGYALHTTGERANEKQMAIIEAHEKGHLVRTYYGNHYDQIFSGSVDSSRVIITQHDLEFFRQRLVEQFSDQYKEVLPTDEQVRFGIVEYLTSAHEITERMSQLKNYFGMQGDEVFTREHLVYARAHYISDTGLDNLMTYFFQMITPDTEATFLKLINSAGV